MKEDYLWDKTGEDAEIEALENTLQAFRFQENAPPELPQKVFVIEKPRRFFRFGLAFAAFAAVIIGVFSFAWLQMSDRNLAIEDVAVQTDEPKNSEKIADDSFVAPRPSAPIEDAPPAPEKPVVVKARAVAPAARRNKSVSRKQKSSEPAETLTAEEKYAYNQLMLALSITGSQLKIVKDKVQGIEEQNAALETAK